MVHIYNGILLSNKKEGNKTNCSNMDGPIDYHTSEIGQTKKDKYYMISLIYGICFKKWYIKLIYKTETDIENKLIVTKGKIWGGRDK